MATGGGTAATLVVPAAACAAGDPSKDARSNIDHKMQTKDGKTSSGATGATNTGAEGGSLTAPKAHQSSLRTTTRTCRFPIFSQVSASIRTT